MKILPSTVLDELVHQGVKKREAQYRLPLSIIGYFDDPFVKGDYYRMWKQEILGGLLKFEGTSAELSGVIKGLKIDIATRKADEAAQKRRERNDRPDDKR